MRKKSAVDRAQILAVVVVLSIAAPAFAQDEVQSVQRVAVGFWVDGDGRLSIGEFDPGSDEPTAFDIPEVEDPVCAEFVSPCPDVETTALGGPSTPNLLMHPGEGWEVDFARAREQLEPGELLTIQISGARGLEPHIAVLERDWTLAAVEHHGTADYQWLLQLAPRAVIPIVEDPDGCWIEVDCPEGDAPMKASAE